MVNLSKKPYVARCHFENSKESKFLGTYATEIEAHNAWRIAKANNLTYWAERWKTDKELLSSFNISGYESLYRRAYKLKDLEQLIVQDW